MITRGGAAWWIWSLSFSRKPFDLLEVMHPFDNRDEQNRDGAHLLLIFQSNRINTDLLKSYLSLVHCARMARLHFLSCGLIYASQRRASGTGGRRSLCYRRPR